LKFDKFARDPFQGEAAGAFKVNAASFQESVRCRGLTPGFTLLELLISLTILSIVVVLVFGGFRIGGRAWEKGEEEVENQQRMRVVFDMIKGQISSACASKAMASQDNATSYMTGNASSMEFMSYASLLPGDKGVVYVKYRVSEEGGGEGVRLSFSEKESVFLDKEESTEKPEDEKDFHELIPRAKEIRFEYLSLGEKEEKPKWTEQWEGTQDIGLPPAVRLLVTKDDGAVVKVIARIQQVNETAK